MTPSDTYAPRREMVEALAAWLAAEFGMSPEDAECCANEMFAGSFAALLSRAEATERRVTKLDADLRAAVVEIGEQARLRGEAEGRLLAAELPGIVEGWRDRAFKAEAERDALAARVAELEAENAGLRAAARPAGMFVRAAEIAPGLHPSDRHVRITTETGQAWCTVSERSVLAGHVSVGWPVGEKPDFYLIEMPRECDDGRWRLWVPQSFVTRDPESAARSALPKPEGDENAHP